MPDQLCMVPLRRGPGLVACLQSSWVARGATVGGFQKRTATLGEFLGQVEGRGQPLLTVERLPHSEGSDQAPPPPELWVPVFMAQVGWPGAGPGGRAAGSPSPSPLLGQAFRCQPLSLVAFAVSASTHQPLPGGAWRRQSHWKPRRWEAGAC